MSKTVKINPENGGNKTVRINPEADKPIPADFSRGATTVKIVQDQTKSASHTGTERIKNKETDFTVRQRRRRVGTPVVLNNVRYTYKDIISENKSGEADIYLIIGPDNNEYILKKYKINYLPKEDVLRTVVKLKHPNIINLIDYGNFENSFFEVMEYVKGGTLEQHLPVKNEDKLNSIINDINIALHHCHAAGVIHRDLKPGNLFCRNEDGTGILMADFGISSMLDGNEKQKKTSIAGTFSFAAPEVFGWTRKNGWSRDGRGIVGPEADYFSLGLTLINLWLGYQPFGNMGPFAVAHYIVSGDVEIPGDLPRRLSLLIRGLITRDLNKRWGFKEVERWLRGEDVPVEDIKETQEDKPGKFDFMRDGGKIITAGTFSEMATLMLKYPEQGKKILYRGEIAEWIKPANRLMAENLTDIVELEFFRKEQHELGLIKAIYILDPDSGFIDSELNIVEPAAGMEDTLDRIAGYLDSIINPVNDPSGILTPESRENAEKYSQKPYLELFLEARGQLTILEVIKRYNHEYSPYKAIQKAILLLEKGLGFRLGKQVFNSFEDLKRADESVHKILAVHLHCMNSKFLCWLEEMGFKSDSSDIEKCTTAETVNLIREMPWLKKADGYLKNRLDKKDEKGWTDLMKHARSGELEACRTLVESGADIKYITNDGTTAYTAAAFAEQTEVMAFLISCNIDINPGLEKGGSLLHELCNEGLLNAAAFLLQQGADVNIRRSSDGASPLIIAEKTGNRNLGHMLLQAGADPNIRDNSGNTAVHYAAGDGEQQFLQLLMKHGGRVFYKDDYFSPLMLAAGNGHCHIIKELVSRYGADPDFSPDGTFTALNYAVQNDEYEAVHLLLKLGAKHSIGRKKLIPGKDNEDDSMQPLAFAVWNGNLKIAGELLSVGADPNLVYNGYSLLTHQSGKDGSIEMMSLLIEAGADVNFGIKDYRSDERKNDKSNLQMVPICRTVWDNSTEKTRLLLENGAGPNFSHDGFHSLHYSIEDENEQLTRLLIEYGADVNALNTDSQSPLHYVLYSKRLPRVELVDLLLSKGADPHHNDCREENPRSHTPFTYAASKYGSARLVEVFLNHGVNPRKSKTGDKWELPTLTIAAMDNCVESMRLLLDHGKGIDDTDAFGSTALHQAVYNGAEEAVVLLLEKGADTEIRNQYGKTAMDFAEEQNYTRIKNMLLGHKKKVLKPGIFILKLVAFGLSVYTFIWTAINRFFMDGSYLETFFNIVLAGVVFYNILFWYHYLCGMSYSGTQKRKLGIFRLTIRKSIAGAISGLILGIPDFWKEVVPGFADNIWIILMPKSAAVWADLFRRIPGMGSFNQDMILLFTFTGILLAVVWVIVLIRTKKEGK